MPWTRASGIWRRSDRDPRGISRLKVSEHFFRHEYGRLVAMLSRRFGPHQIVAIEDAVQSALLAALESWTLSGEPANPGAWLYRAAHNELVTEIRKAARRDRLLRDWEDASTESPIAESSDDAKHGDDLLWMLLVCCDESIPTESQIVIALKTVCGFDVHEIAERLFVSEANVYKRLSRARDRFRTLGALPRGLSDAQISTRLPAVKTILYLLFTEGYLSYDAVTPVRRELCEEAKRLARVLAEHPLGATGDTFALLALMHLHSARAASRQDEEGHLLLLEEQDRRRWDKGEIAMGLSWLERSAQGANFSRYHAEAGIAAEHCLAPSFAETRWDRIVECYALAERFAPSALHALNRAVATAEWRGPAAGLAVLEGVEPPAWLESSYMWSAVRADLHIRRGEFAAANRQSAIALKAAPSVAVRRLMQRRLVGTIGETPK